jgi:hypothetical protein
MEHRDARQAHNCIRQRGAPVFRAETQISRVTVEIYLFMSKTRTVFGFTSHSDGANLPAAFMPWEEAGSITNHTWLATEVMDAIKRHGFYVMSKQQRS